ncbi:DUF748 domain-containing protein [Rufibacter glacialis]|uniref:DUF748 domain-containing protein n=1 Tax=Rufibacter glacialis TaxID=1259555 RepID=A0A5M8QLZ2_9BACT|nr:DUF748 domain-containing protein [Rufibacter glacialis]KAA6437247.1 DUF748 domain-containing protein [Rufibacter glacialis]GGK60802.1 hypothetical protein GCM10011405_06220 [Rufibacter glacialis]
MAIHLTRPLKIGLVVVLLLLAFRIALPYLVKNYVNKTLEELPGYTGYVEDVDISLLRGAYQIDGLVLKEEKGSEKYPFLTIQETDLSIEWKALFKGRLAGEVTMLNPVMNLVTGNAQSSKAAKDDPTIDHWTEVVKDLMPMKINRFEVHNGKLAFIDFSASPDAKLDIHNMELVALNLANVENTGGKLPSSVKVTGKSIGGGTVKGKMRVNALKRIPDFDSDFQITGVNLTSLNGFIKRYAKFDVERGKLDLYSEVKLMDGQLKGYIKPFFEEVKVLNWKKDKKEGGVLSAVKEAVIGVFAEAAENQKRDQIATHIPITGNINNPKTDGWETFVNVIKHAFINAFSKGIENSL